MFFIKNCNISGEENVPLRILDEVCIYFCQNIMPMIIHPILSPFKIEYVQVCANILENAKEVFQSKIDQAKKVIRGKSPGQVCCVTCVLFQNKNSVFWTKTYFNFYHFQYSDSRRSKCWSDPPPRRRTPPWSWRRVVWSSLAWAGDSHPRYIHDNVYDQLQ